MTARVDDRPAGESSPGQDRVRILAARQEALAVAAHITSTGRQRICVETDAPSSDSIPGYEIIHELHRGGQGVVYQAIQKATRRKVAIKVMREGPLATPRDRARFEREVHILSQLKHPNIVAIHDSGEVGQWSFHVMDYVSGQPLDVYVAGRRLTTPQIITLFKTICEAINVAHLRGIVHRDLKPSNIRIDPSGQPHILDFGLAKVSEFDVLADNSPDAMTVTGQFVGSLPWASPEQAEGNPALIDIRTDVYSIGVLLFQLLTGTFPYEVTGAMRQVMDEIVNVQPPRPSSLARGIDDEIDTIVLKCLSKEPARRYQSAGELARDLDRYLKGEPVEAKRDSVTYLLRKALVRYKVRAAVVAGFVLLTLASAIGLWVLYRSAQAQAVAAEAARDVAVRQSDRLRSAMEVVYHIMTLAGGGLGYTSEHLDQLDAASIRVNEQFPDAPELQWQLHVVLALAYQHLYSVDRQRALDSSRLEFATALAVQRDLLGPSHANTLHTMQLHVFQSVLARRFDEAERLAREMVESARAAHGPEDTQVIDAITTLGYVLAEAGRPEEALELHRQVHPLAVAKFGPRDMRTRTIKQCLTADLVYAKRYEEAEQFLLEMYDDAQAHVAEGREPLLHALNLLASLYRFWGKPDLAEQRTTEFKQVSDPPPPPAPDE